MKVQLPYDLADIESIPKARKAALDLMTRQAYKGDSICALALALEGCPTARAFGISTSVNYADDEDDDIRPY